jgi:hypothetical protein
VDEWTRFQWLEPGVTIYHDLSGFVNRDASGSPSMGQDLKSRHARAGTSLNESESEHKVKKSTGLLMIVMVIAALAFAPAAFAQSTGTGYSGKAGGVAGQVAQGSNENTGGTGGTGSAARNASGNSGFLPFTGLDVALLLGGGLLLLGTGAGLSRLVRRQSAA